MRSLRVRVVLVVAIAALVPVLAIAGWTRWTVAEQARQLEESRLQRTMETHRRGIDAVLEQQQRALEGVCNTPGLLAQLTDGEGAAHTLGKPRDTRALRPLQDLTGLEHLVLFQRERGQPRLLLASEMDSTNPNHKPRNATLARLAHTTSGHPFVVPPHGGPYAVARDASDALIGFVCVDKQASQGLALVGVRSIRNVIHVAAPSTPDARLWVRSIGPPGDPQVNAALDFDPEAARDFFTFRYADSTPAIRIVLTPNEAGTSMAAAALDEGFLIGGALALIFAVLLGGSLAWSLARPLNDLEAAAARVGSGDFESTLGVHSDNEIGRALRAFNRMTVDLKSSREQLRQAERIAAWRDIARRIAHEVKNPLLPIQVSIETMQKTFRKEHPEFPEIFEESTQMILDEVGKLDRMVTEFSDFARMPPPKKAPVDMAALTRHVEALWRNDERYALEIHVDENLHSLEGDRDQLSDVFTNLAKNALEAAEEAEEDRAPKVRLHTSAAPGGVLIAVHDSGRGIAPQERSRVFEPYVTGKSSGTGLGLSIVRRIVTDHGGTITIRESPLGGALFEVFLPTEG